MGIVIRQSIKGSIMSYIGAIIATVTTLFVYPYYLTQEQVGLVRLLIEVSLIFSFLSQLSVTHFITNYYPFYKDTPSSRKGFLILVNLAPIIGLAVISTIFIVFKQSITGLFESKSALFSEYFLFVIPLGFFVLYSNVHESYSVVLHRLTIPKLNRDVILKLVLVGGILIYYYYYHTNISLVLALVVAYGLGFFLNFINLLSHVNIKGPVSFKIPKGLNKKEAGFFLFNIFIVGFGTTVVAKTDVLMISTMIGLAYTGVYSISFFMASIIEIPSKSVTQMSMPFLSEAIKNNDKQKIRELYQENTKNQIIIAGFILLLLLINIDNLFAIMPNGEIYKTGKYVVVFISLAKYVDVVTGLNSYLLLYSRHHYLASVMIFVFAVVTISANYLLIPLWGLIGASIAYFLSYSIYNGFVIFLVSKKMRVIPFRKSDFWPLLLIIASTGVSFALPAFTNKFLNIIVWSSLFSIIYWFIVYQFKFSEKINEFINQLIKSGNFLKTLSGK